MNALLQKIKLLWLARNPRERRALSIMAVVVFGAVIAQLVWDASHQREGLRQQLSLRRMELAIMQRQSEALGSVGSAGAAAAATPRTLTVLSGNALDAALRAELATLEGQLTLRVSGPRQIEIKGETNFDGLMGWLAAVHKNHGLRVTGADIRAPESSNGGGGGSGRVSVNLDLAGE